MKNQSIFNFFSSGKTKQAAPMVTIIPSKRKKQSLSKNNAEEKKMRANKSTNRKKSGKKKWTGQKRGTFEFLYDRSGGKEATKEETADYQVLCNQETNIPGAQESMPMRSNQLSNWMNTDAKDSQEVQLDSLLSSNTLAQINHTLNKASVEKRF